jgi:outer membrane receptor protein involved in Fe transport
MARVGCALGWGLGAGWLASASSARAVDLNQAVSFAIQAEPLEKALVDFSTQAHVQVMWTGLNLKDRQAPALSGQYAIDKALDVLLAGSGFTFKDAGPNTIAIVAGTAPAAPPPRSDGPDTHLTEVVVTATKRSKALRDIPASIASIPGTELEHRNAQGVQDIVKLVPGVNYTSAGDSPPRVTMRGISADPATGFTTGTLFGDVSFTDEYVPLVALDPNPFDLKSVDVMKGPQGSLFGASALNGAIRYVPEPVRYGVWKTRYFAQYTRLWGGGAAPTYGGVVNVPLWGEDLALRLMGFERENPGYIDNLRTGEKDANRLNQAGARGILGWTPLEPMEVNFTYAWQNTHSADSSVADNGDGRLSTANRPRSSPNHTNYTLGNLAVRYDLDWAQLVSDSAYVHKSNHNFFDASSRLLPDGNLPLLAQVYDSHSDTWSQELRLVSPAGPKRSWQWVTGLYWSRQRAYDQTDLVVGDSTLPLGTVVSVLNGLLPGLGGLAADNQLNLLSTHPDVTVKELAWFGDLTRRLGPVELSAGGRLYRTVSEGVAHQQGLLFDVTAVNANGRDIVGVADEKGFSPKLSALWHITGNVMAYAAASRGFRVGGVQPGITVPLLSPVQAPSAFKSDSIWNYESGFRTEWFQKTLRLDLTGYYERWKNPQTLQYDFSGLSTYLDNVGGVKSLGGEASLQVLLPIRGLMLSASGNYSDTVTTKPFTGADGSAVSIGTRWPFAPYWQTATTLAYIVELGDWNLNGALTHVYLGKANNNLTQQYKVFGYQQWDVLCSLDNKAWQWLPELSLAANNLLDARGVVNKVFSTQPPQNYSDVTYIQPRSITLRLTGHF